MPTTGKFTRKLQNFTRVLLVTLVTFRVSAVRPVSEDEGGEVDTVHGGAAPGGQPGGAAPQDLGTKKKELVCAQI